MKEEEEEDQYLKQKALGIKPQKGVKCVNFRPNRGGDRFVSQMGEPQKDVQHVNCSLDWVATNGNYVIG